VSGSGTPAGTQLPVVVTAKAVEAFGLTIPTSVTYQYVGRGAKNIDGTDYPDVMTIHVYIIDLSTVPPSRIVGNGFNVIVLQP